MKKPINFKQISTKGLTIDEESRKISGYLAVFNNIDDAKDRLLPGCFSKSIAERGPKSTTFRKIAFLWQHDMEDPIGQITTLEEDGYGLYFEAILDEGVENADRTLTQLKSGTLNQFSIGYQYVWEQCKWNDKENCNDCRELNLFEGSVVTLGMNEDTFFAGMKSELQDDLTEKLAKETEKLILSLPVKNQFGIRAILTKNINLAIAIATKTKKDEQSTMEDEDSDNVDYNLKCIKDAIGNLTDGMNITNDYADTIDNQDLIDSLKAMKDGHALHIKKFKAHKTILESKIPKGPKKVDGQMDDSKGFTFEFVTC
jgi:hypothetical protein